jgi:hypothetical protein
MERVFVFTLTYYWNIREENTRISYLCCSKIVFSDVLRCKIIVDRRFRCTCCLQQGSLMMEAARTSETSVDNYFTPQYIPEDNSELHTRRRENLIFHTFLWL